MAKFFKTILKVEVLSENSDVANLDIDEIAWAITDGDCSGLVTVEEVKQLSEEELVAECDKQGTDPAFFLGDEYNDPAE